MLNSESLQVPGIGDNTRLKLGVMAEARLMWIENGIIKVHYLHPTNKPMKKELGIGPN